jgi:uncharacterized protein
MRARQNIVDAFFAAYQKHDINAMKEVMDENAQWYFLGNHPLAGIKQGIEEIVLFFDRMGKIMASSMPSIQKLIVAENEHYLIECIHSKTNRKDSNNLEHMASVLWTFENDKIIEGRHFFSDPKAMDDYFNAVAS